METPAPKAVFLSYAFQDAAAARRIADALRAFGVEVWFDQSELRGGDAWDAKIRRQIHDCTLFLPIISTTTQDRGEGYFRREWNLAAERTHDMAEGMPFLVPVVVDDVSQYSAIVPPQFQRVQWTRLAHGVPSPQFVEQVRRLLEAPHKGMPAALPISSPAAPSTRSASRAFRWIGVPLVAGLLAVAVYVFVHPSGKEQVVTTQLPARARQDAARAPLHDGRSLAVLPFDDLSEKKDSEYFADGVREELINVLLKVPGLRVAARTSSFFFKGKKVPIQQIARELGVAYVIEGSVRKVADRVRITVQLTKADDGFHVWSDSFERHLKDILAAQEEIAGLVAGRLSLKLGISTPASAIDPEAFRLYLEGRHYWSLRSTDGFDRAEAALKKALALDPQSAMLHAGLADNHVMRGWYRWMSGNSFADDFAQAKVESARAIAIDPENPRNFATPVTLALLERRWGEAERLMGKWLEATPNDSVAHHKHGDLMQEMGRLDAALASYQRAAQLDPFSLYIVRDSVRMLGRSRRYAEVIEAAERFESVARIGDRAVAQFLADALLQTGAKARALDVLKSLLRDLPSTFTYGFSEFVFLLREAGCEQESQSLAERALSQLEPEDFRRAALLAARNRKDEALTALRTFPVGTTHQLFWGRVFDSLRSDLQFEKWIATQPYAVEYRVGRTTLAQLIKEHTSKKK